MPLLDPLLKEILRCPNCLGADLHEDEAAERLRCAGCGLAYPLRRADEFPVMLIEEADKPEGFTPRDNTDNGQDDGAP